MPGQIRLTKAFEGATGPTISEQTAEHFQAPPRVTSLSHGITLLLQLPKLDKNKEVFGKEIKGKRFCLGRYRPPPHLVGPQVPSILSSGCSMCPSLTHKYRSRVPSSGPAFVPLAQLTLLAASWCLWSPRQGHLVLRILVCT